MRRGQILRHEVIVGVERRRFLADELKLSILGEVGVGGATVADVARRHDVTRQHTYQWRQQLRSKGPRPESEGTSFLALDAPELLVVPKPQPASSSPAEISLTNGRTLRCPAGMTEAKPTENRWVCARA